MAEYRVKPIYRANLLVATDGDDVSIVIGSDKAEIINMSHIDLLWSTDGGANWQRLHRRESMPNASSGFVNRQIIPIGGGGGTLDVRGLYNLRNANLSSPDATINLQPIPQSFIVNELP